MRFRQDSYAFRRRKGWSVAGSFDLTRSAYEILGVDESASDEEIRRAYRRRARDTHPDMGGNAHDFSEVQQAWELIGTADARASYRAAQQTSSASSAHPNYSYSTASGTMDFETFLRAAAAARAQNSASTAQRPGYWAEFGPQATWTFRTSAPQRPAAARGISWAALLSPVLAFFVPVLGLFTSIMGLAQTRQNRRLGRNFARWGLTLSLITSAVTYVPMLFRIFS